VATRRASCAWSRASSGQVRVHMDLRVRFDWTEWVSSCTYTGEWGSTESAGRTTEMSLSIRDTIASRGP
jgi:hypothetical protein